MSGLAYNFLPVVCCMLYLWKLVVFPSIVWIFCVFHVKFAKTADIEAPIGSPLIEDVITKRGTVHNSHDDKKVSKESEISNGC